MTNVVEIYKQAIASLDDPILTRIYKSSDIDFCEKMRCYLERAIPLFTIPLDVQYKLGSYKASEMLLKEFTGDGVTKDFELPNPFGDKEMLVEGYVDGQKQEGSYDESKGAFSFVMPPMLDSNIIIKQYQPGYFSSKLTTQEVAILSLLTVSCWAEKEENFLLDIRRLLTTSNFKLNDSSNVLRSKINWHYTMYEKANKLMNSYSWSRCFGGGR